MPLLTLKTVEGLLTPEKKAELHERLTDLLVDIEGDGDRDFAKYVVINITEEPAEHFSAGGRQLHQLMVD